MLPTIHTVAQQAGESIPTTSRILKDYLVGVFSQGNGNPEAYLPQYNWYLGDYQNRDMVLVDTLVHTGRQPLAPDCDLVRRAYNRGKNL